MDIVDVLQMQLQLAVTCTIFQPEIPALLDSWVKNTLSVKMLWPQNGYFSLYFCENITFQNGGLLNFNP
jgi:hypothetical protein